MDRLTGNLGNLDRLGLPEFPKKPQKYKVQRQKRKSTYPRMISRMRRQIV